MYAIVDVVMVKTGQYFSKMKEYADKSIKFYDYAESRNFTLLIAFL